MKSTPLCSVLLLLVLMPAAGHASDIQVSLRLLPEGAWKDSEKQHIQAAAEKAFRRLARADVANCGYRHAYRESADKLRQSWGNQIPVINKSRKVQITIQKKSLRPGVLGQAVIDKAKVNRNSNTIENLDIDISREALHSHLSKKNEIEAEDIWINVIAHEVAHNLGYTHGSGGNWSESYRGYFATEIGFCAMTDGRYGSYKKY